MRLGREWGWVLEALPGPISLWTLHLNPNDATCRKTYTLEWLIRDHLEARGALSCSDMPLSTQSLPVPINAVFTASWCLCFLPRPPEHRGSLCVASCPKTISSQYQRDRNIIYLVHLSHLRGDKTEAREVKDSPSGHKSSWNVTPARLILRAWLCLPCPASSWGHQLWAMPPPARYSHDYRGEVQCLPLCLAYTGLHATVSWKALQRAS